MLGRRAEEYLDAHRAAHLHRMRELTDLKQKGTLIDSLLADHGLFHLEADLRWIDLTTARLTALATEVPHEHAQRFCPHPARGHHHRGAGPRALLRRDPGAPRRQPVRAAGRDRGLIGPSGSGKSMVLLCLAGILVPASGREIFDGQRIDALGRSSEPASPRPFRLRLQFGRSSRSPAEEKSPPTPTGRDAPAAGPGRARSWFAQLELDGLESHRAGEMSGGQAQRVALARGMVAQPDVLFADEPTGSLDSLTGELVMNLMTSVAREEGITVVLVTHEPRVRRLRRPRGDRARRPGRQPGGGRRMIGSASG